MKVNELMIGDLVMSAKNKTVYQIDAAIAYGITDAILRRDQDIDNRFEPLPLTPEILEKNGFEARFINNCYYTLINHIKIGVDLSDDPKSTVCTLWIGESCMITLMKIKIHYVHELQHALRLCGLNDLADSFLI